MAQSCEFEKQSGEELFIKNDSVAICFKSDRLPSLDGWRALSIALVIGAHCQWVPNVPDFARSFFQTVTDGDLGVRFFFIISGFLITWLMLKEQSFTGHVNLKLFYARRALRIIPVYFAFLGVLAALQCLGLYSQSPTSWLGNLTFTTNYLGAPWPSGHLWSLSIEEQFYLLWPGIFLLCAGNKRRLIVLLAIAILTGPVCRFIATKSVFPNNVLFSHYSFFNYFDFLAAGCLCAVTLWHHRSFLEFLNKRPRATVCTGIFLILIGYGIDHLPPFPGGSLVKSIKNSIQCLGFCVLLMQSILQPRFGFFSALNLSAVKYIGALSYSLYIWQQLFCAKPEVFGLDQSWWMSFPGWIVSAFLTASISYHAFESPLLKLRSRFRQA